MKILEDLLGITALKREAEQLRLDLAASKQTSKALWTERNDALGKFNLLSGKVANLSRQLSDAITSLDSCKKLSTADKATIALLQESELRLQAQLQNTPADDLFRKPCPAILEPADGNKVMLGQFRLKTAKWEQFMDYPTHAAIFMPCPIFEGELTAADCNRRRADLTSVQICKALANTAQKTSSYLADASLWGALDNWTLPPIVRLVRQDDCESLAVRIISLIQYYELKFGAFTDYTAMLGLGYFTSSGGNQFGHGFVVLLKTGSNRPEDHYIIEATDNFASEPMKLSDVKGRYDCRWGIVGFPTTTHPEGAYKIADKYKWWVDS